MMNSVLSQEEIDALLNDSFTETETEAGAENPEFSSLEKDALGEIANISMGTAATTLSALLGKKVEITTPDISLVALGEIRGNYPRHCVVVDVNYNNGLKGSNILIIQTHDASVIVDLMMGGDGTNPPQELSEMHLSAISEAMNQMMGSSCTSLSQIFSKKIDITPPSLDMVNLAESSIMGGDDQTIIRIAFRVVIQGLVDSELMQLIPVDFAKEMAAELLNKNNLDTGAAKKSKPTAKKDAAEEIPFSAAAAAAAESIAPEQTPQSYVPEQAPPSYIPEQTPPAYVPEQAPNILQHQVPVATATFGQLIKESPLPAVSTNLDLILDVGLQLSVELGRTTKKIREILDLSVGSIMELDKLAGEPVDILVNGKLLAKGEVVVIDENFGVRITEIISPMERVKNLNN